MENEIWRKFSTKYHVLYFIIFLIFLPSFSCDVKFHVIGKVSQSASRKKLMFWWNKHNVINNVASNEQKLKLKTRKTGSQYLKFYSTSHKYHVPL